MLVWLLLVVQLLYAQIPTKPCGSGYSSLYSMTFSTNSISSLPPSATIVQAKTWNNYLIVWGNFNGAWPAASTSVSQPSGFVAVLTSAKA